MVSDNQQGHETDWLDRLIAKTATEVQRCRPKIKNWVRRKVLEWRLAMRRWDHRVKSEIELDQSINSLKENREIHEIVEEPNLRAKIAAITVAQWGKILITVGLCIAGYFLFIYDTSVEVGPLPFGIASHGERVVNLGLQQNRTLGCVSGMITAAVGATFLVLDKTRR